VAGPAAADGPHYNGTPTCVRHFRHGSTLGIQLLYLLGCTRAVLYV
jgi:hypothetical protein